MKPLLIFLFILTELVSYGQAKIGMSPVFSFTPAAAGSSTVGVQYGDTVTLKVYAKNTGNATFTGSMSVIAKRDTTNGVSCDSSAAFFATLLPNDSVPVILSFTPGSGLFAFKSGGNGNTIVVWPYIISGVTELGDSVRPVVWISNISSVFEFEQDHFKAYPNPVLHNITVKPFKDNHSYRTIIIYDMFARKVRETAFKETTDVSDLTPGSYWMIIQSDEKSYRINFIKE
ncbi:MAG: T9SS type A sorting domain-containing protein [Bacteroidota bacterium]